MSHLKYCDIMEYVKAHPNRVELEEKIEWTMNEHLKKIAMFDKELYDDIMNELYVDAYGEHFNEHLAKQAVSEMHNSDGTTGEYYSLEETNKLLYQYKIPLESFNEYDFYYVMNMLHSDFYELFNNDTTSYFKLAKYWLCDKDVAEGKALRYYMKVVKAK